jgi:biotin--protein ligase
MQRLLITFYFVFSVLIAPAAFSQERDTVYVYQDEGVSEESLKQTILTFQRLIKKYAVTTINAQKVKEGVWTKNAILFVMPGGADLPYVKKLNGKGNEVIKKYVTNGGSFLGICAGSYYGSSYVEFDKNGPLEVLGNRELGFFRGSAIGPILAPYDYKTQSGSRAATINTTLPNVRETTVFYNGGGFFENAEQYPNTKVIGTYDNDLPAIILINYGTGKVLLSGVHFEYDPSLLNSKNQHIQKIIESLREGNELREVLFEDLMTLIGAK